MEFKTYGNQAKILRNGLPLNTLKLTLPNGGKFVICKDIMRFVRKRLKRKNKTYSIKGGVKLRTFVLMVHLNNGYD